MAARKRSRFQIEADRVTIQNLYLQGKPQHEIAQVVEVSREQVKYDLAVIQRRWRTETARNLDEDKARELAKIDHLERTYWQGWERSREQQESSSTSRREGAQGAVLLAMLRKEQRDGNPAFLTGVQWCIDRRCRLLGLDPAPPAAVKIGDNREIHITVVNDG